MKDRTIDDPAFDYDAKEHDYAAHRRTDPRIAAYIHEALGDAQTILNVGAGAGSYEPEDRYVIAVEPFKAMRQKRVGKRPAIIGTADALPFDDDAFDASMATITIHHWPDISKGLKEMRRVTKGAVAILTFDPDALHEFWNAHYFPELVAVEQARYPNIEEVTNALGDICTVQKIPIPQDCIDGFQEAFYARPEAFLQKEVRQAQSAWGFLDEGVEERIVQALADDLSSGEWDRKYGEHRNMPSFTGALRLIVAT